MKQLSLATVAQGARSGPSSQRSAGDSRTGEPDGAQLVIGSGLDDVSHTDAGRTPGAVKYLALPPLFVKECHVCSHVVDMAHIVITGFPSPRPCLPSSAGTSSRLNWVIGGDTMIPATTAAASRSSSETVMGSR